MRVALALVMLIAPSGGFAAAPALLHFAGPGTLAWREAPGDLLAEPCYLRGPHAPVHGALDVRVLPAAGAGALAYALAPADPAARPCALAARCLAAPDGPGWRGTACTGTVGADGHGPSIGNASLQPRSDGTWEFLGLQTNWGDGEDFLRGELAVQGTP